MRLGESDQVLVLVQHPVDLRCFVMDRDAGSDHYEDQHHPDVEGSEEFHPAVRFEEPQDLHDR